MIKITIKFALAISCILFYQDTYVENRSSLPDTTTAEFLQECITYHNMIRKKHEADDLIVKPELIRYSMKRLRAITKMEKLSHGHKGLNQNLGENIYWSKGKPDKMNCSEAMEKWYTEIKEYDFDKGLYSKKTGHFTQMVWIGSTEVGCARAVVKNKKKYEVYIECSYGLSGNYRGEFKENVKKPDDDADRVFGQVESKYKKLNKTKKLPTKKFARALSDAEKGQDKYLKSNGGDDEDDGDFETSSAPIKDISAIEHCFEHTLILKKIFKFNCNKNKTKELDTKAKKLRHTAKKNLARMLTID